MWSAWRLIDLQRVRATPSLAFIAYGADFFVQFSFHNVSIISAMPTQDSPPFQSNWLGHQWTSLHLPSEWTPPTFRFHPSSNYRPLQVFSHPHTKLTEQGLPPRLHGQTHPGLSSLSPPNEPCRRLPTNPQNFHCRRGSNTDHNDTEWHRPL